jgi:hypothetical protein
MLARRWEVSPIMVMIEIIAYSRQPQRVEKLRGSESFSSE